MLLRLVVALVAAFVAAAMPAQADRAALIIANSNYSTFDVLANPEKDASLVSGSLEKAGFSLRVIKNAGRSETWAAIAKFAEENRGDPAEAALLYFAGHGVQIKGTSYFLPIDVTSFDEESLEIEGLSLSAIMEFVTSKRRAKSFIFIIDACREVTVRRPGGRGVIVVRGLTQLSAPRSTFIAYSTSPGDVASDGADDGSPFAKALAAAIPARGYTLEETFREVRRHVYLVTAQKQITWDESALFEPFYFMKDVSRPDVNSFSEAAPSSPAEDSEALAKRLLDEIGNLKKSIEGLKERRWEREQELLKERPRRVPYDGSDEALKKDDQELRAANALLSSKAVALANSQGSGVGGDGTRRPGLTDKAVRAFMYYAWELTPETFTKPNGEVIRVDKTRAGESFIPVEAAREVITAARLSAQATNCKLLQEASDGKTALLRRQANSRRWTPQQLIFISQLHLTVEMLLTGQMKLVDDNGKTMLRSVPQPARVDCTPAQRDHVKALVAAYLINDPSLAGTLPTSVAPPN